MKNINISITYTETNTLDYQLLLRTEVVEGVDCKFNLVHPVYFELFYICFSVGNLSSG